MNWLKLAAGLFLLAWAGFGFLRADETTEAMHTNRRLFGSLLPWKLRDWTPVEWGNYRWLYQVMAVAAMLVGGFLVVTSCFG